MLVLESQKSNGGRFYVWAQWHAVDDAVSRVPPPCDTHTTQEHFDTKLNPLFRCLEAIAHRVLLEGDDAESRGNNPTGRSGCPRPSIFLRIKTNLVIRRFERPSPEPMALSSTLCDK